jgi:hypothetical protein
MPAQTTTRPRTGAGPRRHAPNEVAKAGAAAGVRLRPRGDEDRMTRVYRTIGGGLVADFGRD